MAEEKQTTNGRKKIESTKLDRTLQELESAFNDWDSLGAAKAAPLVSSADSRTAKATEISEQEFRTKTKKLLTQLRQQLKDLGD